MKSMITVGMILTLVSSGCASIMGGGGPQKITLNSTPSGANVTVKGIAMGSKTPGEIKLSRKNPIYVLRFEKKGYEPVEVTLVQTQNGWIWGNILLGGLIGLAIDFGTGAAYKLTPKDVNVVLPEAQQAEKGNSPQEDTLLVYIDTTK